MKRILQILLLIYSLTINYSFCQPCTKLDELTRKTHSVDGKMYGHPYTTFDRHNGKYFSQTINLIRARIKREKSDGFVYKSYKLIYDHANSNLPPNIGNIQDDGLIKEVLVDGGGSSASERALWAKNCAFVMLIGLDGNGVASL